MITKNGTIMVPIIAINICSRPGKRNLAKVYPPKAEKNRVVVVVMAATSELLRKYWPIFII
jgi:hypothetical protein